MSTALVLAVATLALVGVTVWYAIQTGRISRSSAKAATAAKEQADASTKMAEEMRRSRFASFQPIIVMGRAPAFGVIKDARQVGEQTTIKDRTWLYNVGLGPALNLRFLIKEPNRKNPSGTLTGKELRALGPGEAYELMIENTFGQKRLSSHDLIVEYEDINGTRWCSGLELNYTSGADCYAVISLFYETIPLSR